ncbi:MAG: deaminase [Acidobacteriales bacterium]|nr:deaminase [Terriglobales bacterium]
MPPLVIGLTGPFGSGCSETAKVLEERCGFTVVRLSNVIRDEWNRLHPETAPKRSDLQSLGDQIRRRASDAGILAERAIARLEPQDGDAHLVIDGIRNMGETDYFRDRYGTGFFLFALECPTSERWLRLRHIYERVGMGLEEFRKDDEHDRDEEFAYGQQVQLCVDQADVLINNTDGAGTAALRQKVPDYIDLVTGRTPRYAAPSEIFMNLAYSAAHGSKCLKRQVGAVIVAAAPGEMGDIVGQGFNENPAPTKPCVEESQYGADAVRGKRGTCHRDKVREDAHTSFVANGILCPICGSKLLWDRNTEPRWECQTCKNDLEKYFWSERAMTLCTAIHAEVAALFAAGRRSRGATLYTTTFPCFQCTEKIILAGIRSIVFNEPYPDVRAVPRLELAKIETVRFEGVRSRRFDEIFARARRG